MDLLTLSIRESLEEEVREQGVTKCSKSIYEYDDRRIKVRHTE